MFRERDRHERRPHRRFVGIEIEVLMLDSAGLHWKQDQAALFPVDAFALDDRVANTANHIDNKASLMAMTARLRPNFMREKPPMVQGILRQRQRIEEKTQATLAREKDVTVFGAHHDRGIELSLRLFFAVAVRRFIGVLAQRRPLASACAFGLRHPVVPPP